MLAWRASTFRGVRYWSATTATRAHARIKALPDGTFAACVVPTPWTNTPRRAPVFPTLQAAKDALDPPPAPVTHALPGCPERRMGDTDCAAEAIGVARAIWTDCWRCAVDIAVP